MKVISLGMGVQSTAIYMMSSYKPQIQTKLF